MADPQNFRVLSQQFFGLYESGAYQEAVELLEQQGDRFPESEALILAWRSAMLARLGRLEEAVSFLRLAYERGHWYHEAALTQDPDFAALQGDPKFTEIVEQHAMRRLVETGRIRPALSIIAPPGSGPFPAVIALHGNQGSISDTQPFWEPVVEQGWLLALPQSAQPTWASGYALWDNIEQSMSEVRDHLMDISRRYPVNPDCVVAGGFSMGGQIALRTALNPDFHLRGALLVEPWLPEEALAEMVRFAKSVSQPVPRIYVVSGKDNADFYHIAEEIERLLKAYDIPCQLEGYPGDRHQFPEEFASVLARALTFICAG